MKSTTGINQQISKVQLTIMALKAMNTDVQSITARDNKLVIRVSRSTHCIRMPEQGKACHPYTGHDHRGHFRQGVFELRGCRVMWPESLQQSAQQEES